MPQVQRLKKKKSIDKGSKVGMDFNEDGSLYLKFEEENPTLSKFIENSDSVLLGKSENGGTIINDDGTIIKDEIKGAQKEEDKKETSKYSNHISEVKDYDKVDSGSFKTTDKPCFNLKNKDCLIQ